MKLSLTLSVSIAVSVVLSGCQHYRPEPLSASQKAAAFEARSLEDSGLKQFLVGARQPATLPWMPPAKWDFETLTLVAFYFHPSLDVARAQWGVAQAGLPTAGGRPNPTIGLIPGYNFNAASGVSPWLPSLNYDIPIETAGKRGKRITRAEQLSESARLNIASVAWQVRSALRLSLLDHAAAQRRAAILESQQEIQKQLVKLIEQRRAAGAVGNFEIMTGRVALIKSSADLAESRRLIVETRQRIAEALGLSAKAIEGIQFHFDLAPALDATKNLISEETRRQALQTRPDILAALAEYAASQSTLQLEIAKQYPDIHIGSGYQWDQGESKWSFGVTFELPVLNRNEGPIAEARAKRTEVAARFVALQAKAIGEIDRALAHRGAVQEQLAQIETLVRTQRQQLQSVEAAFKAGGADQVELRTAQLEASTSELVQLDAQIKLQQSLGQLEEALQRPVTDWPDLTALSAIRNTREGNVEKSQKKAAPAGANGKKMKP